MIVGKKSIFLYGLKVDSYHTIFRDSIAEIKEKSSRFIAYAYRVTNEGEIGEIIGKLKKEHHSARHHCYAYRIGAGGAINRANDDGEPSGTAGRPILGRLLSMELSDVLVVVVRYFGGTLLGTSGLIAAYGDATTAVLEEAGRVEYVLKEWVRVEVAYADLDRVMKIIKRRELISSPLEYEGSNCVIKIEVRQSQRENLEQELAKEY